MHLHFCTFRNLHCHKPCKSRCRFFTCSHHNGRVFMTFWNLYNLPHKRVFFEFKFICDAESIFNKHCIDRLFWFNIYFLRLYTELFSQCQKLKIKVLTNIMNIWGVKSTGNRFCCSLNFELD